MKIQILGSGCPKCKKLFVITKKVVEKMDRQIELDYLTGIEGTQKIIELGAMSSPVLTVDGKIALVGFTSDVNKIVDAINKK